MISGRSDSKPTETVSGDELYGFFMQAPVPMALLEGPRHSYKLSNPSFDTLVGHPTRGKTIADTFSQSSAKPYISILDRVYQTGESHTEFELQWRDLLVDLNCQPYRAQNGEITGVLLLIQNITEPAKARLQIENERENFRNLFRQTPEMVCILGGPEHTFEFVNEAHIRALGFDATGKTVRQAQPESVEVHGILDNVYKTGVTAELHEISVTLTDRVRYFNLTYSARRDLNGQVNGVMILGVEVTDQVLAIRDRAFLDEVTKTLVQLNRLDELASTFVEKCVPRLADWAIIDLVDDQRHTRRVAVIHPDPTKRSSVEYVLKNPAGTSHNPISWEVLDQGAPQYFMGFTHEWLKSRTINETHYNAVLDLGIGSLIVYPMVSRGRHVGVVTFVFKQPNKVISSNDKALMQEVIQRAALAIDNTRLLEATQKAVHLRDEFLSIASHELKTPLTSAKMQAEMFHRAVAKNQPTAFSPERVKPIFERVSAGLNRMVRLIDDMLDTSRIERGKLELQPEKLDLGLAITEIMERLKPELLNVQISLNLEVEPNVICNVDKFRFEQVLTNLCTNAIRYASNKPVTMRLSRHNGHAQLTFEDHGPGIPQEARKTIFQRFERLATADRVAGMGLGLFICQQIIEAHRGSIEVDASYTNGARFLIRLPLA